MNLGKWSGFGAAAITVLALAYLAFGSDDESLEPAAAEAPPSATAPYGGLPKLAADAPALAASQLGGGLDDTARMFDLGVAGDLTIDMDTKTALEMTLAELGSNPSAADLQRVEDSLRKGLPTGAATQAITLVRNFVAYSRDYARILENQKPPESLDEMRALLDRTEALQRRYFDASTAKGLFGLQQAHSRYSLDVQAVEADTQMSATDKAQRLKALRDKLPSEVAALDPAPPQAIVDMEQKVIALRQQGGSEAEIQRLREQVLGSEGAAALAQMEQQKAQFDNRYNAYLQERQALSRSSGTPTKAQLDALLAKHFPAEDVEAARAQDRFQGR